MSFEVYPIPAPDINVFISGDSYSAEKARYLSLCRHDLVLTVKVSSNGGKTYYPQCKKCGMQADYIGSSKLSIAEKSAAEQFNERASRAHWDAMQSHMAKWDASIRIRQKEKWWAWYDQYLQSEIWRKKRVSVMARSNGICSACRCAQATQVHHMTYDRVGAEPLFDLVAVCDSCHEQLHGNRK